MLTKQPSHPVKENSVGDEELARWQTDRRAQKVFVAWRDLSFRVADKDSKDGELKTILHPLTGHASPGEFVAVIGPSGSGKSSFLNCVGGRNVEGVSGQILFNGVERPPSMARWTGYVVQEDLYLQVLTVLETLRFTAELRMPLVFSKAQKEARVQEVLAKLDLKGCKDTAIGVIGKGISGGERRRLAIAMEIISKPSVLLLDEPTSGLDSASALLVGRILRNLANKDSMTIISTIHQPRQSLAQLFDSLYFLGAGRELYFGPTIPHCLQFFTDCGYNCPEFENPADFLLDLVNTAEETKGPDDSPAASGEQERDEVIATLSEAYLASGLAAAARDLTVPGYCSAEIFDVQAQDFYITPLWNQAWVVFRRSFLHKLREPIAVVTEGLNALILPLIFGSVYWQMDRSQQAAVDRTNAISLLVMTVSFMCYDVLLLFPSERDIFNREQAAGMYRPIAFYLGRTLSEVPQHTIFAAVTATLCYWMYGLQNDAHKFLIFLITIVLEYSAGAGLLYWFGAMSKNLDQSNAITIVAIMLIMLFDGNWVSLKEVPAIWIWVPDVSFIGLAGQTCIYNEYKGLKFKCTSKEIEKDECFYTKGEQLLFQKGLKHTNVTLNLWLIFILNITYRFFAFLCVWLLYRPHSPKHIIRSTFSWLF